MAERPSQPPTAPPVTSLLTLGQTVAGEYGATDMPYHSSALEGTQLHLQQLVQEQSTLGRQVQETIARLIGVNQQLADGVVFRQWFGNAKVNTPPPQEEKSKKVSVHFVSPNCSRGVRPCKVEELMYAERPKLTPTHIMSAHCSLACGQTNAEQGQFICTVMRPVRV